MLARKPGLKALSLASVALAMWGASSCQLSRTITSPEAEDTARKVDSSKPTDSVKGPLYQRLVERQKEIVQGTYEVSGNRLVARMLPRDSVIESRYCLTSATGRRDSLYVGHDTLVATDSLAWSIRQDTLVLSVWQDTSYTLIDSIPYLTEWLYARISGNGANLDGTFRMVGTRDRPLRALPAQSGDSLEILQVWSRSKDQFSRLQEILVSFQSGRLVSTTRTIPSWADLILMQWTGNLLNTSAESTWYDIDMRKLDDTTVSETGRRTKEVVTRRQVRPEAGMLFLSDVSYSSSDTSHHNGVSHYNPPSCPDGVEWFSDFRMDNWKAYGAARRSTITRASSLEGSATRTWVGLPGR